MKEVTRIHIAKISYDIEVSAKKDLEKYIKELELYADDKDVLQDIEIRMTELLAERGVGAGGVIAADDVVALREQLGEPYEFSTGDMAGSDDGGVSGVATRKLYRNTDSAILGGVLSGIASFFRINPLWTRLIFIILLFASFGAVLLVYLVLWIAVPPAQTAAEKLQMMGRLVTLSSIRELNESDNSSVNQHAETARRAVALIAGTLSVAAAIATLGVTVAGGIGLSGLGYGAKYIDDMSMNAWEYHIWVGLIVLAGLLLTTLFVLGAVMLLKRTVTKRLIIASGAVIVMGMIAAGIGIGGMQYQMGESNKQLQQQMRETIIETPTGFGAVTSLTVTAYDGVFVRYIPSSASKIVINGLPQRSMPEVKVDGVSGQLTLKRVNVDRSYAHIAETVTIYGPQLTSLYAMGGQVMYEATDQATLSVTVGQGLAILQGRIVSLTADVKQDTFDGSSATIERANVTLAPGATAELGNIKSLQTTLPEACPSNSSAHAVLEMRSVSDETIGYNGQKIPAKSKLTNCSTLNIGDDGARGRI